MRTVNLGGRTFAVDDLGFLLNHRDWSEEFAEGLAESHGIEGGLTPRHWEVIQYLRSSLAEFGRCPLVYQTCRANGLRLRDLRALFPSGYLRGAVKLAGLSYKEGYLKHSMLLPAAKEASVPADRTYVIDGQGYLVDPDTWDEDYALLRAQELGMVQGLADECWSIIRYLREAYRQNGEVPTSYETCDAFGLDIEELGRLFPAGYQRGAVKIAGLRVR